MLLGTFRARMSVKDDVVLFKDVLFLDWDVLEISTFRPEMPNVAPYAWLC